jgi:hypothetical protein
VGVWPSIGGGGGGGVAIHRWGWGWGMRPQWEDLGWGWFIQWHKIFQRGIQMGGPEKGVV